MNAVWKSMGRWFRYLSWGGGILDAIYFDKIFWKKSYQEDFIKGNFYLSSLATFTKTYAERGLIEAAAQGDRYAKGILDRQRNKSQRDVLEGTIASIPPSQKLKSFQLRWERLCVQM